LNRFAAIEGCFLAVEKSLLGLCLPTCLAAFGRERLGAWVPNEEADLTMWLAQPIRQITTDRPDLALKARAELGP
jgi:glycerophosphoryl diester phosphodiesterase